MQVTRKISGMANLPDQNKFRIWLECGHSILYDHSVDSIKEYNSNVKLICKECKEEGQAC